MPTSCCEIATPPISQVSFGNGLGNARTSAVQIRLTRPLKIRTRPIVTITIVSSGARSIGRMTTRCDAEAEPEGDHERQAEREPVVQPWFSISVQAM